MAKDVLIFDVMLGDRFIRTLRMPYCPLFIITENEIKAFVEKKLPTLKNKNYRVLF